MNSSAITSPTTATRLFARASTNSKKRFARIVVARQRFDWKLWVHAQPS